MRGSKPGERRGGRQKGTRNKRTEDRAVRLAKGISSGELPLAYMLRMMRDETADKADRNWAAGQAAPFIHPRLQSTVVKGDADAPLTIEIVKFAAG